ncbi:hypothetical protein GTW52_17195 [Streptomyces sp. SID8358]|nr:hypothetical protein [Streptomyces sp. SID8358]
MSATYRILRLSVSATQDCIAHAQDRIEGVDIGYVHEPLFGWLELRKLLQRLHVGSEYVVGQVWVPKLVQDSQVEIDVFGAVGISTSQTCKELRHPLGAACHERSKPDSLTPS